MPGLGGAVEAGPDVERGKVLEGTRKEGPVGVVVAWKECAGESDQALKMGITKSRLVWGGAKAECGRGRAGAKSGARPEREMLPLSLCVSVFSTYGPPDAGFFTTFPPLRG